MSSEPTSICPNLQIQKALQMLHTFYMVLREWPWLQDFHQVAMVLATLLLTIQVEGQRRTLKYIKIHQKSSKYCFWKGEVWYKVTGSEPRRPIGWGRFTRIRSTSIGASQEAHLPCTNRQVTWSNVWNTNSHIVEKCYFGSVFKRNKNVGHSTSMQI